MKRLRNILIGIAVILYISTGFYTIGSGEMGVVTFFGRVVEDKVAPGIHYNLPWLFVKVYKPSVGIVKRMSIGFKLMDQVQDIPPSRDESERLSGDSNVITVSMMVQYTVRDPADYLFATEGADFLLRKAGEAFLCEKVGNISVDELLTVGKLQVEQYIRQGLQAFSDSIGAGFQIRSCNLQKVEPPQEVIESFNEVSRAKADREKIINEAHSYHSDILPKARAQSQKIFQQAQAESAARISQAEGEVARFEKLYTEYRRDPSVLKQRLYWDTIEDILQKARKIIIEENQKGNLRIVTSPP